MRNSLIFGGVNSADYGIYITGKAVFNAPKRVVDKIAIPGRNGLLVIDQGRYENIPVNYPAFAFGKNRKEFKEKIEAFRNAIASQIGYQRLADTYNPEEYRMALFSEGLDVDPGPYGGSGKFTLSFDCKPQRFLLSGEEKIDVNSGDKIINPTLFNAQPLVMVEGYGTIQLGESAIVLNDEALGAIEILGLTNLSADGDVYPNYSVCNQGDLVDAGEIEFIFEVKPTEGHTFSYAVTPPLWSEYGSNQPGIASVSFYDLTPTSYKVRYKLTGIQLYKGVAYEPYGFVTHGVYVQCREDDDDLYRFVITIYIRHKADDTTEIFTRFINDQSEITSLSRTVNGMTAHSTVSILGHPTYIDCDMGEAYKIESGAIISLNRKVDLGSDLPSLTTGETEITYDNTITDMKVIPRWWKV